MTEAEYLVATNRVKVSTALAIIRDILPGPEWGISDAEVQQAAQILCNAESRLFSMIKTDD